MGVLLIPIVLYLQYPLNFFFFAFFPSFFPSFFSFFHFFHHFPLAGLGCEVAKNVILAGVDKMTLCDDENVSKTDFDGAFFLPRDSIGKNRAEAGVVVICS